MQHIFVLLGNYFFSTLNTTKIDQKRFKTRFRQTFIHGTCKEEGKELWSMTLNFYLPQRYITNKHPIGFGGNNIPRFQSQSFPPWHKIKWSWTSPLLPHVGLKSFYQEPKSTHCHDQGKQQGSVFYWLKWSGAQFIPRSFRYD